MKRPIRAGWIVAVSLLILSIGAAAVTSNPDVKDLDAVVLMPDTHKVLFENAFVRVIESRQPAGSTEVRHWHPHNVTIALSEWDADLTTFPEGKTVRVHRTAGTASWNEAGIHEVHIGAGGPSHVIRVELKY
jgi:beta-alanine degradation protein BauB